MAIWPRTKKPIGFSLEYSDWAPGEDPREIVEHFDDRDDALRRVRELDLHNWRIWHSDGISAAICDAAGR